MSAELTPAEAERVVERGFFDPTFDDVYPEFEEALYGAIDSASDTEPEYDIVSLEQLDWAVGKIGRLDEAIAAKKAEAAQRVARIERWCLGEIAPLLSFKGLLEARARAYHRSAVEVDPRRTTIKVPSGALRSTATQPAWEIDDARFVAWATENDLPELLRLVARPAVADVKTKFKELLPQQLADWPENGVELFDPATGELIPGVRVSPPGRNFRVVPAKADDVEEPTDDSESSES